MNNFDEVARTWDENPVHTERSIAIAQKMEEMIPLSLKMKALEFGAGTGILSFILAGKLDSIVMMDSSQEMVLVMEEKIIQRKTSNLFPLWSDQEHEIVEQSFDLIFNQMVLHHIADVPSIFDRFFKMILPGGFLAIADLYPEDGSFHGKGFDGHKGFDPEKLKVLLLKTGFTNIDIEECYSIVRKMDDGTTKAFPVFLVTASKK